MANIEVAKHEENFNLVSSKQNFNVLKIGPNQQIQL